MSVFEQFPYTNMQNLNLDWILKTVKKTAEYVEHIDRTIDEEIAKQLVLLNLCSIIEKLQAEYIPDTESVRLGISGDVVAGHFVTGDTMTITGVFTNG